MPSSSAQAVQQIERRQKVLEVLRHYVDRRSAGETVSDAEIIESHRDLMPELGRELRVLGSSDDETLMDLSWTDASAQVTARLRHTPRITSLPGYEQFEEIKAGGQGVVYRATQTSTGQRVAIKAIQGGPLASEDARTRLLRETRILGSLKHPNVVRVFDSGLAQGTVFYVMEHIAGRQLDEHLTLAGLDWRSKVDLFGRICDGVNAAHLLGVIHRDLKPSNVLVDTEGNPRLVDFGLAKVSLPDGDSDLTEANSFLGTAKYAAPEQCARRSDQVDVRADVYSLGVMLFEAIAGEMPYKTTGSRDELLKRIQKDPPRDLKRTVSHVPADLAAIVARCLRKDPAQRYQNAGELGRDLRNLLRGEPIDAKRDNLGYVLLKRAGRYRWQVLAGAAVVLFGMGQAAFANYMWGAVEDERDSARAVTDLLVDTIHGLDPSQTGGGAKTPLHAELANAVADATDRVAGMSNPEAAARVRAALGHLHLALGEELAAQQQLDEAVPELTRIFGADHPETLAAAQDRGFARKLLDRYNEAESIYQDVLARRMKTLGTTHLDVASTQNNLGQLYFQNRQYDKAEEYLRSALKLREDGGAPPRALAGSLANLGSMLRGQARRSRTVFEKQGDPSELEQREQLLEEADDLLRRACELREVIFEAPHLHIANSLNKLGLLERERGLLARDQGVADEQATKLASALATLERSREMKRRVLPDQHWEIAVGFVNVGMTLNDLQRYDEAAKELTVAFERFLVLGHRRGLQASLAELIITERARGQLGGVLQHFVAAKQADFATADDASAFQEWLTQQISEVQAEVDG